MNTTPYQLTDNTVTVFVGGVPLIAHRPGEVADGAIALLADNSLTNEDREHKLLSLFAPATALAESVDDARVTVENNRVLFDGENIPSALARKIISVVRAGLPLEPWKRFTVRLFANPSRGAQAELNEFLEVANLPITEDGCFLAYKRVTVGYRDLHTGTFDNSVGKVVEMKREDVDPDRDRTCSRGLHFCSQDYLRNFYSGNGRIVIVKVNPTDVVSIPSDYSYTKGRTWRYEVVGEVDLEAENAKPEWGVYDDTFDAIDNGAVWDDPLNWDADDDTDDVQYCECGEEYEPGFVLCKYCDEEAEGDGVVEDGFDLLPVTPGDIEFTGEPVTRLQWLKAKFGR